MAKRKNNRRRHTASAGVGVRVFWSVMILLLIAGGGLALWKFSEKVNDLRESLGITETASEVKKTEKAKEEKKTTAAEEETQTVDESDKEEETTTAAPAEEDRFPEQSISQEPLNQLISVVGWAMADVRPDGFHSKYLEKRDVAALTIGAMTLAAQGRLGLDVELTTTDDPDQAMLSSEDVNTMLAHLVKDAVLEGESSMGVLVPMGSGWAVTLPDDEIVLPRTEILENDGINGNRRLTAVLIQDTTDGEMVLQSAVVEASEVKGGFGYQLLSWVTQDEMRFSREDGEKEIILSLKSEQRALALELTWSDAAGEAVVQAGDQVVNVKAEGTRQVVLLKKPSESETITITLDNPAALTGIRVH